MTRSGTSTNILVDDLYRKAGGPGFRMFEFTALGVILMAVGIVYIVLLSQRLLPNRAPLIDLMTIRQKTAYITELVVEPDSPFVGQPVTDVFQRVSSIDEPKQATIPAPAPPRLAFASHQKRRTSSRRSGTARINPCSTCLPRKRDPSADARTEGFAGGCGTPNEITRFVERNGVEVAPVLSDGKRVPVDDGAPK